jgi:3-methyladenine DNA glycosylase AlkD
MNLSSSIAKRETPLRQAEEVLKMLKRKSSSRVHDSMKRFGIVVDHAAGISTPVLKALARTIRRDHRLAAQLWETGVFEARIIAALIDEPHKVTRRQMDRWAGAFDSWGICDGCCCYLFRVTPFAWTKAVEWAGKKPEYVKRAGFALMAYLAVHDKEAEDEAFAAFLPIIERESGDNRLYVRKAVNWALRQIGKRNLRLHRLAVQTARRIQARNTPSARWIAADALRELRNEKVRARTARRGQKSEIRRGTIRRAECDY